MFNLRNVTYDDVKLLFDWANDSEARANALNPKKILWDEHTNWLKGKLSSKNSYMYILTNSRENIGVIRFDKSQENFVISYSVDKKYRGKGLGMLILRMGLENICNLIKNPIFIGYVKKGNIASEKIFNRLNFSIKGEEIINEIKFIIYKKTK